MKKLLEAFHPEQWTPKFYFWVVAILLALNLFSPKGIVQWVIVKQEGARLESRIGELQNELQVLKNQIRRFEASDRAKIHAIHEELGYLRDDELSLEFTEDNKPQEKLNTKTSAKPLANGLPSTKKALQPDSQAPQQTPIQTPAQTTVQTR